MGSTLVAPSWASASRIPKRSPFAPCPRSVSTMSIIDMPSIVIDSLLLTAWPGLNPSTGASMNGSSLVPAPPMNFGSALVFSGSGPTSTASLALSRLSSGSRRSRRSRRRTQHSIHR